MVSVQVHCFSYMNICIFNVLRSKNLFLEKIFYLMRVALFWTTLALYLDNPCPLLGIPLYSDLLCFEVTWSLKGMVGYEHTTKHQQHLETSNIQSFHNSFHSECISTGHEACLFFLCVTS